MSALTEIFGVSLTLYSGDDSEQLLKPIRQSSLSNIGIYIGIRGGVSITGSVLQVNDPIPPSKKVRADIPPDDQSYCGGSPMNSIEDLERTQSEKLPDDQNYCEPPANIREGSANISLPESPAINPCGYPSVGNVFNDSVSVRSDTHAKDFNFLSNSYTCISARRVCSLCPSGAIWFRSLCRLLPQNGLLECIRLSKARETRPN